MMNDSNSKKLDCYWTVEGKIIKAICKECHKKEGWFWEGSKLGYGDYDLKCSSCNKIINEKAK